MEVAIVAPFDALGEARIGPHILDDPLILDI